MHQHPSALQGLVHHCLLTCCLGNLEQQCVVRTACMFKSFIITTKSPSLGILYCTCRCSNRFHNQLLTWLHSAVTEKSQMQRNTLLAKSSKLIFVQQKGACEHKVNTNHISISLGDIHNMPTFWVLELFGDFYNFCFHVQTCRHLGGGGVYTF